MYEQIKELIKQKKSNIDSNTLTYFTNYFYVAVKENVIPKSISLEDLIDNALTYASKIEFYDKDHRIYKELGPDVKGIRDPESKIIFIRDNLEEPLREITIYHELHHATQTNPDNDMVGVNQESNIGRLIMESQTQYFAELVYQIIHNIEFQENEIPSEQLRMLPNGIVISSLHNYQMYDNILSKLSIILNVSKKYFVSMNYLTKNNEGLKNIEKLYNETKQPFPFKNLLFICDYIYSTDLLAYTNNPAKEIVLAGKETDNIYIIHPKKGAKISLKKQREFINKFDIEFFLNFIDDKEKMIMFSKYIIDNDKRKIANNYIKSITDQSNIGNKKTS